MASYSLRAVLDSPRHRARANPPGTLIEFKDYPAFTVRRFQVGGSFYDPDEARRERDVTPGADRVVASRALPDFCNSMMGGHEQFNYDAVTAMFRRADHIAHRKDAEVSRVQGILFCGVRRRGRPHRRNGSSGRGKP